MRTEGQGVKRRLSFPVRETEYFDLREGKIKMQGWGSDSQRSEALSSPCASHRMKGRSGCRQGRPEGLEARAQRAAAPPCPRSRTLGHQMPGRGGHVGELQA